MAEKIPTVDEIYDALMPKKVIKKGDMSPETKALPDEVIKPPKGIGKSENDMGPRPPRMGGLEFVDPKDNERVRKSQEAARVKMLKDIRQSLSGPTVRDAQGNIEYKKKGGVIKDLKKAGFYDAKKDKAKRLSIINKVTTKPERIEMVDKMFSAKKMAKGGTASSRADGCAVRGKTRA
jgi:hypothetical protein